MLIFLSVMFGLEPDIHGHKALAHDMHAESNALQQRFAPQPVMRSSWLQLARFNKGSRRSLRALKGVPLSSRLQLAIFGLDPNIQEIGARIKPEHDRNA